MREVRRVLRQAARRLWALEFIRALMLCATGALAALTLGVIVERVLGLTFA